MYIMIQQSVTDCKVHSSLKEMFDEAMKMQIH